MLYYITLSVICLSFLSSLMSFKRDYPFHLRLISMLLGFTGISEIFITRLIRTKWPHATNIPWYNIVMGIEFFVYGLYYYLLLEHKGLKKIISVYLILLPVFWFFVTFTIFNFTEWNSYLDVAGSLVTICLSVALYHQLFTAPELVRLSSSAEFWIATALILYYCGNLPFTGMMHFLTTNFPVLAGKFITLLQILNIVLYSLISFAFLCRINTKKSSSY